MDLRTACVASAIFGTSLLLAGCGGAQAPGAGGLPMASTTHSTGFQPLDQRGQGCQNGDLEVSPCHTILDTKNPGPVTVTLSSQGHTGKITEKDDCGTIATITEVMPKEYSVAAGTTTGKCTAEFDSEDQGGGKLHVDNKL